MPTDIERNGASVCGDKEPRMHHCIGIEGKWYLLSFKEICSAVIGVSGIQNGITYVWQTLGQ